jgi:hypothetical protein
MNEPKEPPPRDPLMCVADGCPMRWSVDMGNGKLCTWHDSAPLREWPFITGELQRMREAQSRPLFPKKHEYKPKLAHPAGPLDTLHWARSLRHREAQGEHLTPFQRDAWRTALRHELAAEQREGANR